MEKKVYDANELDKEVEVKEPENKGKSKEADPDSDPEEEEEEEEEEDPKRVEKKKTAKKEDADPGEEEEEEEEKEADPKNKKQEDPEDEEEEEEEEDPADEEFDTALKGKLFKKYGIQNLEELEDTLTVLDEAIENQKKLKAENEELKKAEPKLKFASKDHEAAYEFIKEVPKNLQPERLITLAELRAIDLDNADPKQVLRQQYILKHPELTREEIDLKFDRFFEKKYTVDAEAFDDDEKRKKEEKLAQITMKSDVAKAKTFLATQKDKFKAPEKEEEAPVEVNETIKKSIARNAKEMDEFFDGFSKLVIPMEGGKFKYSLAEDEIKMLRNATEWVKNPELYSEKGELKGFDPKENAISAFWALFHKKAIPEMWKQAATFSSKKQIEEIAGRVPNRKAKGPDASKMPRSEEQQWEELLKNKESKKKSARATA